MVERIEGSTPGPFLSRATYREASVLRRIGNRAVQKAQEENRRLGIPNAYSHHGQLYFEWPRGVLTQDDPFESVGTEPASE